MSGYTSSDGAIVLVATSDDFVIAINPEQENDVRAALRRYVATGKTRDEVLELTLRAGGEWSPLVSTILSIRKTTAADRLRCVEMDKAGDDENKEHRRMAGYPDAIPGMGSD